MLLLVCAQMDHAASGMRLRLVHDKLMGVVQIIRHHMLVSAGILTSSPMRIRGEPWATDRR
jgi:hypothetical protein